MADFGTARLLTHAPQRRITRDTAVDDLQLTTYAGTCLYMAPEILEAKPYDSKCDVYSFGICLNEIRTRLKPFADLRSRFEVEEAVIAGRRPQTGTGAANPEDQFAEEYEHLTTECWSHLPEDRPSFQEIVPQLEAFATS